MEKIQTTTTLIPNRKERIIKDVLFFVSKVILKAMNLLKRSKGSRTNTTLSRTTKVFSRLIARLPEKLRSIRSLRKQILLPFSMGIILILIPAAYLILRHAEDVGAWYDDNWNYRVRYTINNTGSSDSNKKMLIEIDTESLISDGKMQEDCGDSGFVTINGLVLKYYIDEAGGACNTSSTNYWVLIPTIHQGETVIYHYYGNRTAADGTQSQQFTQDTFDPDSVSMGSEETGPGPVAYWKMDEGYGEGQGAFIEQEINIMDQEYANNLWWDETWTNRQLITISNPNATELTDFQVKIALSYNPSMNSDFSDIRFIKPDGSVQLDYYLEQYISQDKALFWVKIDSLPASSNDTDIYAYYGNASANSLSNGNNTFVHFEGFEDEFPSSFDTAGAADITLNRTDIFKKEGSYGAENSTDSHTFRVKMQNVTDYGINQYRFEGWAQTKGPGTETNSRLGPGLNIGGSAGTNNGYQIILDNRTAVSPQIRVNTDNNTRSDGNFQTAQGTWYFLSAYRDNNNALKAELWTEAQMYGTSPQTTTTRNNETTHSTGKHGLFTFGANNQAWDGVRIRKFAQIEPSNVISDAETVSIGGYAPTDNSLGIIQYNPARYNSPNLYFEAVVSLDGTNWEVVRSEQLDPINSAKDLTVRVIPGDGYTQKPKVQLYNITDSESVIDMEVGTPTDTSIYIRSARLKNMQRDSTAITLTQTQVEVGGNENSVSTSHANNPYEQLNDKKIYAFNAASYSPTPSTRFEASIKAEPNNVQIEQQINILNKQYTVYSSSAQPTDNSLGLIQWDASAYPNATVYLEAVATMSGGVGTTTVFAELYTSTGTLVSGSTASTTSGSYTRIRSGAITLSDGVLYTVRIRGAGTGLPNSHIKAARLVVIQSDPTKITDTQTQIEVGNTEKGTSGTPTQLTDKKIYYYDSSKFSPAPTAYFEASLRNSQPTIEQQINILNKQYTVYSSSAQPTDNSLGLIQWDASAYPNATVYLEAVATMSGGVGTTTVFAELYTSTGTLVSGSTASTTSGSYTRIRSGAITLSDGVLYTVRIRGAGTGLPNSHIKAARLVVIQSDPTKITDTQTQIEVGNTEKGTSGTPTQLTDKKIYYYDSSKFSPAPTAYFEASLRNSQPTIEQQINILNTSFSNARSTYRPINQSFGSFKWDAAAYSNANVYFEAIIRHGQGVSTTAQAALFSSSGSMVSNSELSTGNNTYTRLRSGNLNLSDGEVYHVRLTSGINFGYTGAEIKLARLIIIQSDPTKITATQTSVELGNIAYSDPGVYSTLENNSIYYYDSSKFSPAPTAYFEATFKPNSPRIEQEINMVNRTYSVVSGSGPHDNSLGIIWWDGSRYPGATVYFEAVTYNSATTSSSVSLFDTNQNLVAGSTVSVGGYNQFYSRVRSGPITLVDNTAYTVNVGGGNGNPVYVARIIVVQENATKITDTETQIEVGSYQAGFTNTTYAAQSNPKYYYYDQSKFSPTPESTGGVEFHASVKINDPEDIVYAELYNRTTGNSVAEVSLTGTTAWTLVRAFDVQNSPHWNTDSEYDVRIKCEDVNGEGCAGNISLAKIVLYQTDTNGIESLETTKLINNRYQATTNGNYQTSISGISYENFNYGVKPNIYFETVLRTATTNLGYVRLVNIDSGNSITGSVLSTNNNDYTRLRSGEIDNNLPLFAYQMDSQLASSSSQNSFTTMSRLIVQIQNLPTDGNTGYVALYNNTDGGMVTGSELTYSEGTSALVRSGTITLLSDKEYEVRIKGATLLSARIILRQEDVNGITDLELTHQYISTTSATSSSTPTSQLFNNRFNPDYTSIARSFAGGELSFFFEATMKTSAGTGFARLTQAVAASTIETTNTDYERVRTAGAITNDLPQFPQNGTFDLDTQIYNSGAGVTSVSSSWIIVQISNLATNGVTTYADLYNLTDGETVLGSEVSTTSINWTSGFVRSPGFSLTTDKEYVARLWSSHDGAWVHMQNAKILLHQEDSNGITNLETLQLQLNTLATRSGDYTSQVFTTWYNPDLLTAQRSFAGGALEYFYEATMKTDTGTGLARLTQASAASTISTTSTDYERVRTGSAITNSFPQFPQSSGVEIDTQLSGSGGTVSASSSWVIVQISNLATNGVTTYADLYSLTDGTAVSGSEVSTTSINWTNGFVRSSDFSLETDKEYIVRLWSSQDGAWVHMQNAKILLHQEDSNGITDLETVQQYVNTRSTQSGTTYVQKDFINAHFKDSFLTGNLSYQFEATMRTTGETGYAILRNRSDSNNVTGSELTTTSTDYERVRSPDITANIPDVAKAYDTSIRGFDSNQTTSVSSSWLLVQVRDLGEVTAYAALYENGSNCTNMVSGSEVSVTYPGNPNWARVRTGANITLDNLTEYMVCTKASPGGRVLISNAKVIHDQTSDLGVTSVELYHTLNNTFVTHNNTTYENRNYPVRFDPSNFHDIYEISYEATIKTDSGTGYTQLYDKTGETAVTDTELLTTSTSYERLKTSDIYPNLSSDPSDIDLQIKSSSTNVTSVSGSYLVIRANGISTAILNDSTANRHNGTLNGGTWKSEADCKFGGCIYWDGISNHSEVTHSRKLDFKANDSFTISTWIKRAKKDTDNPTTDVILAKYESVGSDGGYKLYMNPDGTITFGVSDTNSVFPKDSVSSTTSYDDNFWHHVVAIKDGTSSMLLYIDLDLVDIEDTITSGNLSNNDSLFIAIDGDGVSNPFNGHLDEMKIYPYARSFDEIQMEYLNGAGSKGNSISFGGRDLSPLGDGLIGYWKMDESEAGTCSPTGDSCDSSGNYANASWIGNPSSAQGKFGNALSLGGTNDRAFIGTSDWYEINENWSKRSTVTINNNTSSELNYHQVKIEVPYEPEMQNNFGDIRFSSSDNLKPLNYWIESILEGTSAVIWVKIPSIPANDSVDIYMYYGNSDVTTTSDGDGTFEFFDDATGEYTRKWHTHEGTASYATVGGRQAISLSASTVNIRTRNFQLNGPMVIEADLYETSVITAIQYYQTATPTTNARYQARMDVRADHADLIVKDGWEATTGTIISTADTWYPVKLSVDTTGTHRWYVNNILAATLSNDTTYTSGYLALNHHNSGTGAATNVRVRKFASEEPSISFGITESSNYQLHGSWLSRIKITFDNSESTEDLVNFPVLVKLDQTKVDYSKTQDYGEDIRFTDSDNTTLLSHEIELWNKTGESFVWVKVPNIPAGSTTDYIYMYYNNPKAPDGQNITDVWSSNYVTVSHLHEDSGTTVYDSSSYSNNGNKLSSTEPNPIAEGTIGGAQSFDGVNDIINYDTNGRPTNNFTFESWFTANSTHEVDTQSTSGTGGVSGQRYLFGARNQGSNAGAGLSVGTNGISVYEHGDAYMPALAVYSATLPAGWNHVAVTYTNKQPRIYLNGTLVRTGLTSPKGTVFAPYQFGGGSYGFHNGYADEMRVSNVSRSANWIKASYKTMVDNYNIYNSEETRKIYLDSLTQNITISAWVTASTLDGSNRAIVSRGDSPSEDWYVKASGASPGKISFSADGGTNVGLSNTTLLTGNWYHILMSAGEGRTKLYVNGVLDSETDFSGVIPTEGDLGIGNNPSGGTGWHGLIDDVRLYNKVLTDSDVFNLFKWAEGPIAYWNFDEGAGTTAYDRSGNVRHGTLTNGPRWSEGKFGKAVSLDGVNDHIRVFHNPDFDITDTSSITISGWFNRDTFNTNDTIIAKKNSTSLSDIGYMIYIDSSSDKLNFLISDGTNEYRMVSERAFTQNGWNHFVVTFDPLSEDSSRIYINGSNDNATKTGTLSSLGDSSNELNLIIGSQSNISNPFGGKIDDIKIHNHILRVDQIIEEMNAGHPPVGTPVSAPMIHLKFDEGYGNIAHDSTIHENHGNLAGSGTTCPQEGASACPSWINDGRFGKALRFDGDDYVDLGNPDSLGFREAMTISFWINTSSYGSGSSLNSRIISKNGSAGSSGWEMYIDGTTNKMVFSLSSELSLINQVQSVGDVPLDEWMQYTGVYIPGEALKIYVNGVLDSTQEGAPPSITNNSNSIWIGGRPECANCFFEGDIDDLKIYNYALDDSQIALDHNKGMAVSIGSSGTTPQGRPSDSASSEYCVPGDSSYCAPPVSEWRLSENHGTIINDTSGNNNFGTLINNPLWSRAIFGSGLDLDGFEAYVQINDTGTLDLSTDYTISAWVYPRDLGSNAVGAGQTIYANWKDSNASPTGGVMFGIGGSGTPLTGMVKLEHRGGSSLVGSSCCAITPNKWQFLTATMSEANTYRIYLNNLFSNGATLSTITADFTDASPKIGRAHHSASTANPYESFNGMVGRILIYDYPRTPAQIAWDFNKGGPIAWYKFDECEGTTLNNSAYDPSGAKGNNASLVIGSGGTNTLAGSCNSGSSQSSWNKGTDGKRNSSIHLDGTDDHAQTANHLLIASNNRVYSNVSWGAWVRADATQVSKTILQRGSTSNAAQQEFRLTTNSLGHAQCEIYTSEWLAPVTSTLPLPSGEWTSVICTYDGTSTKIYVNGIMDNSFSQTGNITSRATHAINIGRSAVDNTGHFQGSIDDLKIWPYALTNPLILREYSDGAVSFGD
jgi:hypothetical protein